MSLSSDVLARATPTRLICRGGRWVLELTRLEAVDRDVFQPRLQRLEGIESILALLRRSEEGQLLATGAAQLMRAGRGEDDRAFDASEGDWIPSGDAPAAAPAADVGNGLQELASVVAELRAELFVLRASHARMRERVMALEAAQSGTAVSPGRLPRAGRTRRRSEPPGPLEAAPEPAVLGGAAGFAATQASPGLMPAPVGGAPQRAGQPEAAPAAMAAAADVAAAPAPAAAAAAASRSALDELMQAAGGQVAPLGLPTVAALSECLSTLMDAAPALELVAGEPMLWKLKDARACRLLDDSGRERGAILLDLTAAVHLGALLLSLPRDEAARQVRENQPSDDVLLATSEICNNLTGPVNAVPKNDHVRSTALASVDVGELPQVRASLSLTIEGGRVVLAMF